MNAGFAYDIRGEVVCEDGTVELSESAGAVVKRAGAYGGRVPEDWRERFVRAFDTEFQAWIDAVAAGGTTGPSAWDGYAATKGESTGPSSWDGYAATVVCAAGLDALNSGERVEISMVDQPELYRTTAAGPTGTD